MKKAILFVTLIVFVACGTKINKVNSTAGSAAGNDSKSTSSTNVEKLTPELEQGKNNYEKFCQGCHKLKDPNSRTAQEWQVIEPKMCEKYNKKAGAALINDGIQSSILNYLVAMGKK